MTVHLAMNAVVLMATPCPKSLHGKGEKWIARNILQGLDSRQPMTEKKSSEIGDLLRSVACACLLSRGEELKSLQPFAIASVIALATAFAIAPAISFAIASLRL